MKRKIIRNIGLLILVVLIGMTGIGIQGRLEQEGVEQPSNQDISQYAIYHYEIEAEFFEGENIIKGQQQIQYKNIHKKELDTIYFHLYPNAFKEKDKVPFPPEEMERAYPMGFEPGYIEIEEVKVEDVDISYAIQGEQKTILAISLPQKLKPNEGVSISIKYHVKIPPIVSRFGYGENTYNFGNWYPIVAVYDEGGWNLQPYYQIGDPFYSEVSNYKVTLTLPEKYVLATTGNIVKKEKKINGNSKKKVWTIEAEAVRDFAWVISEDFKILKDTVNGIDIQVYYFDDQQGKKALEVGRDAISIFSKQFGPYPYKQFSVVSCDFYIGGMEYPNLVYVDQNIFNRDATLILEYIIAHEAAHQWWYGIVGNNQIEEPWVDEALTEYSTILYFREKYGEAMASKIRKEMVVYDYIQTKNSIQGEEIIARSVDEFNNSREYSGLVYSKGAMMFHKLEEEVGRENFQSILQYYVRENQFSNVTGKNIQAITKVVTGKDYEAFFRQWLGK